MPCWGSCTNQLTAFFGTSSLLTALLHMPEKLTAVLFLISKAVALVHVIRFVLENEVKTEPSAASQSREVRNTYACRAKLVVIVQLKA
eukprot:SAG11_NODE_594_length_8302_cov_1.386810_12_plen_88_part_00